MNTPRAISRRESLNTMLTNLEEKLKPKPKVKLSGTGGAGVTTLQLHVAGDKARIHRMLKKYDANSDGELSRKEFAELIRLICGEELASDPTDIAKFFDEIDTNKSNSISYKELWRLLSPSAKDLARDHKASYDYKESPMHHAGAPAAASLSESRRSSTTPSSGATKTAAKATTAVKTVATANVAVSKPSALSPSRPPAIGGAPASAPPTPPKAPAASANASPPKAPAPAAAAPKLTAPTTPVVAVEQMKFTK